MHKVHKKLNIAYLDQSHIFSGAEVSLKSLVLNINCDVFNPSIIYIYPMPHQVRYKDLACVKHYLVSKPRWWMGSDYWENPIRGTDFIKRAILGFILAFRLFKNDVDILHINLTKNDIFWWIFFAKITRTKVVLHCRSDPIEWVPNKILQKFTDRIISVSDFIKNKVLSKNSSSPVVTVYDPVAFSDHGFDGKLKLESLALLGIDSGITLLSSIGLLSPHKGHDIAIQVFCRLLKNYPDSLLCIAGGGSEDELIFLKNLAKSLCIEDKVIFTGEQVDDLDVIYRASDLVFSLTKRGEAFGRVPFESTSYGTPVIAPEIGGSAEIINDNETGFLVNTLDIEEVTAKANSILSDLSRAISITEKGRLKFKDLLAPVVAAEKVEKVYLDCIKN